MGVGTDRERDEGPRLELTQRTARPDVFVSYSRAEIDFVRKLTQALETRGKRVWVDWDDIPKSSEWWDRIERGIESSRAIVVVVSPDFAASEVCGRELEYATEHRKHVIPVISRDVPPEEIPAAVRTRNWIFMRAEDSFEHALEEVLAAVDTDLEWLDEHARLLVRSREWAANGRDGSFLLRGRDLGEADEWLSTQGAHSEGATSLQSEYIQASKRSAVRRQRLTLSSVAVALVVSLVLGALAAGEWRRAVDRQRLAQSRQLAAEAEATIAADPRLGLQRAVDAAEVKRSAQADEALRLALANNPLFGALKLTACAPDNAAFAPEARFLLCVGVNRAVSVVDASRGTLKTLRSRRALRGRRASWGEFAGDGTIAYVVDPNQATFWRTSDWSRVAVWHGHFGSVSVAPQAAVAVTVSRSRASLRRFPSGDVIRTLPRLSSRATISLNGQVLLTTGHHGAALWTAPEWAHPALADRTTRLAQLSPDGRLLADARFNGHGGLAVWRTSPLRKIIDSDRCRCDRGLLISPDKTVLATFGDADGLWDLQYRTGLQSTIQGHSEYAGVAPAFNANSDVLITAGDIGQALVWDSETGDAIRTLLGTGEVVASALPSTSTAVTLSTDAVVRSWELPAPTHVSHFPGLPFAAGDGTYLTGTTNRSDDSTIVWRARIDDTGQVRRWRRMPVTAPNELRELSPTGRFIVGRRRPSTRYIVQRASDGAIVHGMEGLEARLAGGDEKTVVPPVTVFSPNDDAVAIQTGWRTFRVYSVSSNYWHPIGVLHNIGDSLTLALSPGGKYAFTAGRLWDVHSGRVVRRLSHPKYRNSTAVFSPDGRQLATTFTAYPIEIRAVPSGSVIARTAALKRDIRELQFNRDGTVVATLDEDGAVKIWDTETGALLTALEPDFARHSILFDSSNHFLLTIGDDGVQTWHCEACLPANDLLNEAQARLRKGRSHTPDVTR